MKKFRGTKKKKGRCIRKNKQRLNQEEPEELKNAPHSLVITRGNISENIKQLCQDFRKVMEPYTASSLKARKSNRLKDFLAISGVLHVSHICAFSCSEKGNYLKVARAPQGPTLYFKILNYSLAKDVVSSLKKQLVNPKLFQHSPLLIMNSFNGEQVHSNLMASMFQNMFPAINLTKVNLNNVRRCALLNYNIHTNEIDFRHYSIKVVPTGLSKGVKKMVQNKVPNLSKFREASDLIAKGDILSESEMEDDPATHVTLPQKISSRGNAAQNKSSIRLVENGPRMTIKLLKIEEGFFGGEVLYHSVVVKTEEEKAEILKRRLERRRLKEERKKFQEDRKKKKELEKLQLKEKSLKGMKKGKSEVKEQITPYVEEVEDDDDVEWYKQEVGKDPDSVLFNQPTRKAQKRKLPVQEKKRGSLQKHNNEHYLTKKKKSSLSEK